MKDLSFVGNGAICFFDSGIGGLTLLNECANRLTGEKFVYFADNENVPYGSLPKEELLAAADSIFAQMSKLNPAAAVIACNTVTAQCAAYLRKKYAFPIIGIQPAVKPAAKSGQKCVVLATPSTAASASIKELVEHYGNGVTEVVPCPELAAYIENNILNLDEKKVCALLPQVEADAVVLGCTHYIYIENTVKSKYNCPVYDGLDGTARRLCGILGHEDHQTKITENLTKTPPKVWFCGGDEVKNQLVFTMLNGAESGVWGNFSH